MDFYDKGSTQQFLNKTGNSQKVKGHAHLKGIIRDGKILEVILEVIWENYIFHEQQICTQNKGHIELHPEPIFNTINYQKFTKNNFFK